MQVPDHVPALLVGGGAHLRPQPSGVDERVVLLAHQRRVLDVRAAPVNPVQHMMRSGPGRGFGTPREGTPAVPAQQPTTLRPSEQAHHTSLVQVLPGGAEHIGDQRRVTRDPPQHLRRQQHPGRGRRDHLPRPRHLLQVAQRDRHMQRRRRDPRPRAPWPPAIPLADRHTSANASTRRCPAGRRSRSPVSSFGTGALSGPIAASSTAACSGVTTSWYSVTSPDATHGCDNRATDANRCCRSSNSPAARTSRSSPGAACASAPPPTPCPAPATPGHRRHRLRGQPRLQPGHLTQRRQRQPRRHARVLHPRPHHPKR